MHKKHILFVLEYFHPHIGGVETLFSKIVDGLLAEGHKVTIVTSRYDQDLPKKEDYAEDCTIYRVGHGRFDFMRYGLWKANKICKHKHVDLIHATTFMAAIPAGILRWFTGLPTVLHVHEIYGQLWYRFLGKLGHLSIALEHIIFTWLRFDKYLCVSHYTKNNLRIVYGIPDSKLMTVYNAIDYDYWKPIHDDKQLRVEYGIEDRKIVLFFGRPGVAKGLQDIIQAIPTVVSQNKGVQFILIVPQDTKKKAGFIRSTVDEQDYKEILTEYADNITWVPGARGETLQKWIATADLVCLPSHAEGFGFAIAEVCAMGKPLITTSVASIPEVVSGEIIFVEPANPGQIAEQVSAYFNGSAKLHTITPKIFTRDSCIQSVISVYQELLDHSSKK